MWSFSNKVIQMFLFQARDAEARGDQATAQSKGRVALTCNIIAMVWWVVALVIIVVASSVVSVAGGSYSYCSYSSTYGYQYCYK